MRVENTTVLHELAMVQAYIQNGISNQPSSPNSFVNLSCTSRSALLTVGFCLESTLSKSPRLMRGGMICDHKFTMEIHSVSYALLLISVLHLDEVLIASTFPLKICFLDNA